MKRIVLSAILVCFGSAALAHPAPKSANPKPNAVLAASPTEIRIGFSEALTLPLSGAEVKGADGKAVAVGAAMLNPKDKKELVIPLASPLAPGSYTVNWHVVGDDTHRVTGHFSFQVKP